jgi:hypothetical protein
MKVKTALTTVEFATVSIWAYLISLDLGSSPSHVLLAPVHLLFSMWAMMMNQLTLRAATLT